MLQVIDMERIQQDHPEALALGRHRTHIREHMWDIIRKMGAAEPEQMRGLYDELTKAVAELGRHVEAVEELFKSKRKRK